MIVVTLCLNATIAAAVCWLTYRLWQWRKQLKGLNQTLHQLSGQATLSTRATGYNLALKRGQIAEARLAFAQIQMRSHQLVQTLRLIRALQALLLYRRRRYARSRR